MTEASWEDLAEGDVAEVHQSLLEPQRFLRAPYMPGLVNVSVWFVMTFGAWIWMWAAITVPVHILMWLVTRKDIYTLEILRRYCRYARFYGV